jgi:hypothetical protein
MIDFIHDNN